jgi:hypothetical protein
VNKSEQWTISTKQQFTSSSWITYGEGKDGVERSTRSGASVKLTVGDISKAIEVDGVLRAKRSRSRAKRSSGIEGEAVEVTACSEGEAIEGALRRRRR